MKRTLLFLFGILALTFSGFAQTFQSVTVKSPENTTELTEAKEFTLDISVQNLFSFNWGSMSFDTTKPPTVTNGTKTVTGSFSKGSGYPTVILTLDETVTEPGTYTLEIPAGSMKIMATQFTAYTLDNFFTIVGGGGETPEPTPDVDLSFTVSPENGSEIELPATVTLTWGEGIALYPIVDDNTMAILRNEAGDEVGAYTLQDWDFDNKYSVEIDNSTLPSGAYTLTIPADAFELDNVDNLDEVYGHNDEIVLTYTIKGEEAPEKEALVWKAYPYVDDAYNRVETVPVELENGQKVLKVLLQVEGFSTVNEWSNGFNLKNFSPIMDSSKCYVTCNGDKVFPSQVSFNTVPAGIMMTFNPELSAAGVYNVVVEEGLVEPKEFANNTTVLEGLFTIAEAAPSVPTVDVDWTYAVTNDEDTSVYYYEDGIHKLSSIKSVNIIVPRNYTDPWTWNESLLSQIVLSNGENEFSPVSGAQQSFGTTYKVTFENVIKEAGAYTLYLPQGLVSNSTGESAAAELAEFATVVAGEEPAPAVNYFEDAEFIEPVPGVVTYIGNTYKVALPKLDGKSCDVTANAITISVNGETVGNAYMGFVNNNERNLVFYTNNDDLTAPGEYIVTIPAGALTVEGTSNTEAITAVYTIEANYFKGAEFIEPVPGVVTSLGDFRVYLPNKGGKNADVNASLITISNGETTVNANTGFNYSEGFVFYADEITAPGVYTVTVPAGAVTVDGKANTEAIVAEYTIEAPAKPELDLSYTVTPESGSEIELPATVTFIYTDEVALYQLVESGEGVVALYDESGNKVADYDLGGLFDEPANEFYVNITSTDLTAGEYTLVIPAGVIEFNDVNYTEVYGVNPEMTVKYVVKGEDTPTPPVEGFDYVVTPEPGSTLDETTTVTLTYAENIMVYPVGDNFDSNNFAVLLNEEGEEVANFNVDFWNDNYDVYLASVTVTLGKLYSGKYTLHIPAGTIEYDNHDGEVLALNEDINVEYNIVNIEDGVEAIFGDAAEFTVYDLNGNLLVKNGDKNALENLSNGVYVINGKKVILRR